MKLKILLAAGIVCSFAACKTPYKATDTPMPKSGSTSATADSTASSNTNPLVTDSAKVSAKIDSIRMPVATDSIKTPAKMDSVIIPSIPDSTKMPSKIDSVKMPSIPDSTKNIPSVIDSAKTPSTAKSSSETSSVPEATKTAFAKKYPGASNAVWSGYDSLAAVPIDLRMAGFKKMNTEDQLVKFDLDGENYYAWYDSDGNWVGSAYNMKDFTKLPAPVNTAVKNAIKTRYAGYDITNVNKEFQKGKTAYEVELKKEDSKVRMLVSADGKITQVFKYVSKKE
ncbi:MAG: hypothetical protein ABI675_02300 [Chitinophagaceae bacterium]